MNGGYASKAAMTACSPPSRRIGVPIPGGVKGFRLRVADHEFEYSAGQHTTIRLESGDERIVRPYPPTNLPGCEELPPTGKRYDDGLASSYLHQKRPGDTVEIGLIEGALSLADPSRDIAFIASGTASHR